MFKGRVFLSIAVLSVACVGVVVACDDNEAPSSFDESQTDSGFPDTGSFVTDSGTTADSKAPVNCTPSLPATFVPAWKPPTKASVCTTTQLGEYYDACLTTKQPDAGDPCKTWTDANASCATCIEPTDNTGPIQWHRDRYYHTLNVAGCLALERGEASEGQCPATYAASIQCQRDSCGDCFLTPNATFADFQKCQGSAKTSACATYEAKIGEICGTTYNDPDGGAFDCFKHSDENSKTHFVRVEGIFCGQ